MAATGNNWILIKCVGTRSNRSAIGTRVKVTSGGRSQIDEVMSGSSYYSQNDFRLHFGLGALPAADSVELAWPSGVKETFRDLPANHLFVIQETKGIVSARKFRVEPTCGWRLSGAADLASAVCLSLMAAHAARMCSSPTSPRPSASTSSTRTPPPRTSTWSRPWAAAWRCWTTTTTAGWTSSSRTARRSTIRCRTASGPTSPTAKFWNRLYHQNADGTFTDVTEKAGLTGMPQNRYGMGVAVGDYDNDGFDDLYVTSYGGNTLYHNNGDGTFTDVTEQRRRRRRRLERERRVLRLRQRRQARPLRHALRRLDASRTTATAARRSPATAPTATPTTTTASTNILYHNNGDGTFTDVSAKAGIADPQGKGLGRRRSPTTTATASPTSTSPTTPCSRFLYHNNGNGTFTEVGLLAGVGFNEDGKTFAGMGVDFADYDNDGRPDIVVTDLSNERYMLFRQNGDGSFRDVTNASGLGGATLPFSGWSTHFFDYDNDGWKECSSRRDT